MDLLRQSRLHHDEQLWFPFEVSWDPETSLILLLRHMKEFFLVLEYAHISSIHTISLSIRDQYHIFVRIMLTSRPTSLLPATAEDFATPLPPLKLKDKGTSVLAVVAHTGILVPPVSLLCWSFGFSMLMRHS